jgi:hypothetical protein
MKIWPDCVPCILKVILEVVRLAIKKGGAVPFIVMEPGNK